MIQGELDSSSQKTSLLSEGKNFTEVREMSRHGCIRFVCKLYGITVPLLDGHRTVELQS